MADNIEIDNNDKSSNHKQHTTHKWVDKQYVQDLDHSLRNEINKKCGKLDEMLTTHIKKFEDFTTEFKGFTLNVVSSDDFWQ